MYDDLAIVRDKKLNKESMHFRRIIHRRDSTLVSRFSETVVTNSLSR